MTTPKNYSEYNRPEKENLIRKHHHDEKLSIREIARMYGTYPNKIIRDARKFGIEVKERAEVLKDMYETGQLVPKTPEMTEERKDKISNSQAKTWEENKERLSEVARTNLKKVVKDKSFEKKRVDGFLLASEEGSKIEKFIYNLLLSKGYQVDYHKEHLLKNERLHIDLLIPKIRVAIEVDGPTHSKPLFGHAKLYRTQIRDNKKTGALMTMGYVVIHVKVAKKDSRFYFNKVGQELLAKLLEIENKFPKKENRNITLEVKE